MLSVVILQKASVAQQPLCFIGFMSVFDTRVRAPRVAKTSMRKGQKKRGCGLGLVRATAVAGVTLWVGVFLLVVRQHASATSRAAVPALPASSAATPLIRRAAEGSVLPETRDPPQPPLARPAPVSYEASAVTAPLAAPQPRFVPRAASVDPHTGLEMEVDSYTGLRVPAFWEPPPEFAPPGVAKPPKHVDKTSESMPTVSPASTPTVFPATTPTSATKRPREREEAL